MGVSIALPWFESLPAFSESLPSDDSNEPPVRLAILFSGNGYHKDQWWAKGTGADMELGKVLDPLNAHREKLLFIRGLWNEQATKGNIHSS